MQGNITTKYLVATDRVCPTVCGFLMHVNHPAVNVTLSTLKQKLTGCRPLKKSESDIQMTNIHHENSADVSTLHETGTTQQITQTDCNFHDQSLKQAPKPATTFNKEPVAS
jgi:hypothetical protein